MSSGWGAAPDFVLRGGTVVDGRGGPRYRADVVLRDGRVHRLIAAGEPVERVEEIDVAGLIVAPGFIDMHAHSDLAVLADRDHLAKDAQGVTLEVVGQDGLGYSPVTDMVMEKMRDRIAGWNGRPDLDYSWRSIADYLARVDRGAPVNVAVLVPHGTVRMIVMGADQRPATPNELKQIVDIVAQGLRDGAMGMSTGLTYHPGMYASDDEIIDALSAVREVGGYYCPHHRNYGARVTESYEECIEVARRAEVPKCRCTLLTATSTSHRIVGVRRRSWRPSTAPSLPGSISLWIPIHTFREQLIWRPFYPASRTRVGRKEPLRC